MKNEIPLSVTVPDELVIPDIVGAIPIRGVCHVNGLALNYLVWGDRTKPPVVLVHGGKDHCRNWDWSVRALLADYCLITPDLRGHGDSDRASGGGYDGHVFVSDFYGFMAHLEAEGFVMPLALIGHSLGGNIVLTYSAIAPAKVSRVIAIEGLGASCEMYNTYMEKPAAERLQHWVERRIGADQRAPKRFSNPEDLVTRMAGAHRNLCADQARHLALHAAQKFEDGWGWKHDPYFGFFPPPSMTSPADHGRIFSAIKCPTLLMRGTASWASDPVEDGRINAFADARLVNYEGAGHWLHHDRFDDYIRDVRQFLIG